MTPHQGRYQPMSPVAGKRGPVLPADAQGKAPAGRASDEARRVGALLAALVMAAVVAALIAGTIRAETPAPPVPEETPWK